MSKDHKRIDKAIDTLTKRQWHYTGEIMYSFYQLPGTYIGPGPNELPGADNKVPRADSINYVDINGKVIIYNIEDETWKVDEDTLEKISRYILNTTEKFSTIPVSVITTTVPKEKCLKYFKFHPSQCLNPIIISLIDYKKEVNERLNIIKNKIKHKQTVSDVDAMNLIMAPRIYDDKKPEKILEKVCVLLRDIKVSTIEYKQELIIQMQCVIHKYAKTMKDIKRLEKVINVKNAIELSQHKDNVFIANIIAGSRYEGWEEGKKEGLTEGKLEGEFIMALKIRDVFGIKEAARISEFSLEELKRGVLNSN